jgi:hypothetical protein
MMDVPINDQPGPSRQLSGQLVLVPVQQQQDPSMMDGAPSRQLSASAGFAAPVTEEAFMMSDGLPARQMSSGFVSPGPVQPVQGGFVSPMAQGVSQDALMTSGPPSVCQSSANFCAPMSQDEAARLLESAMPERYEE